MGQIRAALEKANLLERTVVIISADHGEALFEHGWIGHNVQLYDESMHVPSSSGSPRARGRRRGRGWAPWPTSSTSRPRSRTCSG
jgi:arylsulfatase A-like enzyme